MTKKEEIPTITLPFVVYKAATGRAGYFEVFWAIHKPDCTYAETWVIIEAMLSDYGFEARYTSYSSFHNSLRNSRHLSPPQWYLKKHCTLD